LLPVGGVDAAGSVIRMPCCRSCIVRRESSQNRLIIFSG
jgi:hypothetical protein